MTRPNILFEIMSWSKLRNFWLKTRHTKSCRLLAVSPSRKFAVTSGQDGLAVKSDEQVWLRAAMLDQRHFVEVALLQVAWTPRITRW
jgi:hypothetical protein